MALSGPRIGDSVRATSARVGAVLDAVYLAKNGKLPL